MIRSSFAAILPTLLLSLACGTAPAGGNQDAGAAPTDAGAPPDAGSPAPDAGVADAGSADAGDTWANYADGFVTTYCLSCHGATGEEGDPAGSGFNFTTYAGVQTNSQLIRCGVAVTQDAGWDCGTFGIGPEQFPIGSLKPTTAERDRFVAWIEAGLPQ